LDLGGVVGGGGCEAAGDGNGGEGDASGVVSGGGKVHDAIAARVGLVVEAVVVGEPDPLAAGLGEEGGGGEEEGEGLH